MRSYIMEKIKLISELSEQIKKCLLISDEEKKSWLLKLDQMPVNSLQNLLKIFKQKNFAIEEYIKTSLLNDPDQAILQSFKSEIKNIKTKALDMEHSDEGSKAEDALEQSLKQI